MAVQSGLLPDGRGRMLSGDGGPTTPMRSRSNHDVPSPCDRYAGAGERTGRSHQHQEGECRNRLSHRFLRSDFTAPCLSLLREKPSQRAASYLLLDPRPLTQDRLGSVSVSMKRVRGCRNLTDDGRLSDLPRARDQLDESAGLVEVVRERFDQKVVTGRRVPGLLTMLTKSTQY